MVDVWTSEELEAMLVNMADVAPSPARRRAYAHLLNLVRSMTAWTGERLEKHMRGLAENCRNTEYHQGLACFGRALGLRVDQPQPPAIDGNEFYASHLLGYSSGGGGLGGGGR